MRHAVARREDVVRHALALGPDCADPFSPKAVRASMGAIFAMPVARVTQPDDLPAERIGLVARATGTEKIAPMLARTAFGP